MTQLLITSEFVCPSPEVRLHVQRVHAGSGGTAVLMIHGLAEDKHIYHQSTGGGLAVFLATAGYDVYVCELRGYGKSRPELKPGMEITQHEIITQDLPAFFELIQQNHPDESFFGVGHGWGSVWLASALVRQPEVLGKVAGLVHFGASRELDPLDWFMRTVSEYPGRTLLLDGDVWADGDLATEYLGRLGYQLPEQGLAPVIDLASRRKAVQV